MDLILRAMIIHLIQATVEELHAMINTNMRKV